MRETTKCPIITSTALLYILIMIFKGGKTIYTRTHRKHTIISPNLDFVGISFLSLDISKRNIIFSLLGAA